MLTSQMPMASHHFVPLLPRFPTLSLVHNPLVFQWATRLLFVDAQMHDVILGKIVTWSHLFYNSVPPCGTPLSNPKPLPLAGRKLVLPS